MASQVCNFAVQWCSKALGVLSFPPPSLPLDVGPLNPARVLENAVSPPAASEAKLQPKSNLVHFSIQIRHMVEKILGKYFVENQLSRFRAVRWPIS